MYISSGSNNTQYSLSGHVSTLAAYINILSIVEENHVEASA